VSARRNGLFALVAGAALLAVPAWQLWQMRPGFFYSDQSSDSLWVVLAYAGVGVACGLVGATLLVRGTVGLATGGGGRLTLMGFRFVCFVLVSGSLAALIQRMGDLERKRAEVSSSLAEQQTQRPSPVAATYALAWQPRGPAPGLALSIPASDLPPGPEGTPPVVAETVDGPRWIDLVVPGERAALRINRDDSSIAPYSVVLLNGLPTGFDAPDAIWIAQRGPGWKLLGLGCPSETVARYPALSHRAPGPRETLCFRPETKLEHFIPGLFGLAHLRMYAAEGEEDTCAMTFRYRERTTTIVSAAPCVSERALASLAAGMKLLGRLTRDSAGVADGAR
jgi:hypothetical protein